MDADAFDLAGFCVGIVERDAAHRRRPRPGPATRSSACAASGLHANGYSLVRALVAEWDLDLDRPYQEQLRRTLGDAAATWHARPSPSTRWRRSARCS